MKIDADVLRTAYMGLYAADKLGNKQGQELGEQLRDIPEIRQAISITVLLLTLGHDPANMVFGWFWTGVEVGIKLGRREAEVESLEKLGGLE